MNDDATINEKGGKYAGMDRYEARKAMVADLEAQGLLVKVVPHTHAVGTHDRCHTTVEPMIKPQWFVRMKEMAQAAMDVLKTDDLNFVPERFDKIYLHWLGKHQGLVYFAAALVGAQDSGVVLPGLRRNRCAPGRNS